MPYRGGDCDRIDAATVYRGLRTGSWQLAIFFRRFYLFAINCVFIAFFDLVVFQAAQAAAQGGVGNGIKRRLQSIIITAVVLAVMIPSGYMASGLVRQEIFNTKANSAIATAQQQEGFFRAA